MNLRLEHLEDVGVGQGPGEGQSGSTSLRMAGR